MRHTNTFALLVSLHELVSARAQCLHSDEMERRRRGKCKLGRERKRARECVCGESERALKQRHVGDVVWLPQAEERGGVGERLKSADGVSVRERETKAGGKETRSKARESTDKEKRETEGKRNTCLGQQLRRRREFEEEKKTAGEEF